MAVIVANGDIVYFNAAKATATSFKIKENITDKTRNDGTKSAEIMEPLKDLSNFWRTLETSLINCEFNYIRTWSANCVILSTAVANQVTTFSLTDIPVVTLSTQDNAKLLQQLQSGFKRTIYWNKCQSKVTIKAQNPYLDYLIDPSFQAENKFFALSFENNNH